MNWLDGDILSWPFLHANGKWKHSTANVSRNFASSRSCMCIKWIYELWAVTKKAYTWPDVDSYRDEGRASRISMIFWWARYLYTRYTRVECAIRAFVLHLQRNLRTIVLDATVDLLLSHALMMSFFLGNVGSDCASLSQSSTTSRKRTLEWASSLPPASITFRREGFPREMTRGVRGWEGGWAKGNEHSILISLRA